MKTKKKKERLEPLEFDKDGLIEDIFFFLFIILIIFVSYLVGQNLDNPKLINFIIILPFLILIFPFFSL